MFWNARCRVSSGIVEDAAGISRYKERRRETESRLGDTEKEMANRISKGIIDNGADTTLFMCFGSGPRTIFAHGAPTDRKPQESEIIRFDLGGRYGPYYSDFARLYGDAGHDIELTAGAHTLRPALGGSLWAELSLSHRRNRGFAFQEDGGTTGEWNVALDVRLLY